MTLVVDASLVVAGLTDSGADGRWAEALLAGDISVDVASLAHTDLLDLRVEFFPYQPRHEPARAAPTGRSARARWAAWRWPALCNTPRKGLCRVIPG